jgi:hypothetical protein
LSRQVAVRKNRNRNWSRDVLPHIKQELERFDKLGIIPTLRSVFYVLSSKNIIQNTQSDYNYLSDYTAKCRKRDKILHRLLTGMKRAKEEGDEYYNWIGDNTFKILDSHGLFTMYVKYRHKYLNAPIVYYEKETKWGGYETKKYILNMDEVLPVDCFSDQTRGVIQDFIDEYKTPEQYIKENLDFIGNLPEDYKKLIPRWHEQPYYVELWTEKSAMVGTFRSMLEGVDVRIVYNRGFDSISNSWSTYQRIRKAWDQGKKVVILYCGDLDPSGDMMDETIKDIMNVFFDVERYENDEKYRFKRIAILPEHIERFKLPKNPDKKVLDKLKQDPRKERFKEKYDLKSDNDLFQIEIDALAAFNPEELKKMLRGAILPYREHEIYDKLLKDDKHSYQQISLHIRKNVHKFLEEQNIKSFMEYFLRSHK